MFNSLKTSPRLSPVLILRLGLGLTFLYASLHMLFDPSSWVGFIPQWVGSIIAPSVFLLIHSIFELLVSIFLLSGIFLPAVSFLAFLDFVAILLLYGVDDLTFRDFGLALAALALFAIATQKKQE